ncbi:MAG: 30S ribosomal protein S6 [Candidatus Paceibacterota bacterium]|jgi:ribosomal protein S6
MEIEQETKVYEIGFHIVPTVPEDAVSSEFEAIKSLITKEGGEIIASGSPELKTLAYSISKTVKAVKSNYTKAYFGWVKFTLSPEAINKVKVALDASDSILRHLIINTIKESTLWSEKDAKRTGKPSESKEDASSEEEIEKEIDALVIN